MNLIDILVIAMVIFKISIGFLLGVFREACGVLGLVAGALAAYLSFIKGASLLVAALTFIITNLVFHVVCWIIIKLRRKKKAKSSLMSRAAGGAIGSIEGAISVCALAIALHFLHGIISVVNPGIAATIDNSFLYSRYLAISKTSLTPGVKELFGLGELLKSDERADTIDPAIVGVLRENASVKALLEDKQMLEMIRKQDYGRIIMNPKYLSILNDKELMQQLVALGIKKSFPEIVPDEGSEVQIATSQKAAIRLEGIVFSESAPLVIIGSDIYPLGAEVSGGKIVEITTDKMTVQFPDSRKEYLVGAEVP